MKQLIRILGILAVSGFVLACAAIVAMAGAQFLVPTLFVAQGPLVGIPVIPMPVGAVAGLVVAFTLFWLSAVLVHKLSKNRRSVLLRVMQFVFLIGLASFIGLFFTALFFGENHVRQTMKDKGYVFCEIEGRKWLGMDQIRIVKGEKECAALAASLPATAPSDQQEQPQDLGKALQTIIEFK